MERFARVVAVLVVCLVICSALPALGAVIRVKWDSTYDGPGNDWDHAYHAVQAGINAAASGDMVWVARGTYVGCITLNDGVALYGGFAGNELALAQRPAFPRGDTDPNETVLDGAHGGSVVTLGWHCAVDGCTIVNGNADMGGGISGYGCTAIRNNRIAHNHADNWGGGIRLDYSVAETAEVRNNFV